MNYSKIQKAIEEAPMSWLPALFVTVVKACASKQVFRDKAALLRVAEQCFDKTSPERKIAK